MMPDSRLRQVLLGTWRLISFQAGADGTVLKPYGDDPPGYLVYTPDGHVLIQVAARQRPELFRMTAQGMPALLDSAEADTELGYADYCEMFKVRDGQIEHHIEVSLQPRLGGLLRDARPYSMVTG